MKISPCFHKVVSCFPEDFENLVFRGGDVAAFVFPKAATTMRRFLFYHFLATVYACVLFDVGPVGILATAGVCLAVAAWAEESEICDFVVCSASIDVVYL